MAFHPERTAIVGATGPTVYHLARELVGRGWEVPAAGAVGARCLLVSSYWSFLPHRGEVVSESHPRGGGHEWFRLRREAEDVLLAAAEQE